MTLLSNRDRLIAVVGSRGFQNVGLVRQHVEDLHKLDPSYVLLSGGARGVDTAAEEAARYLGHGVVSLRPSGRKNVWGVDLLQWHPDGRADHHLDDFLTYRSFGEAAYARNDIISEYAPRGYAFWDRSSPGTRHTIERFLTRGKFIWAYDQWGKTIDITRLKGKEPQAQLVMEDMEGLAC